MHVEKETSTEQLFEVKQSKHGVFTLVKQNDEVKIAIKNQIVTENVFKTFEEAEKYISKKPYDLILISCYLYHNHITEQLQYLQNNNNKNN